MERDSHLLCISGSTREHFLIKLQKKKSWLFVRIYSWLGWPFSNLLNQDPHWKNLYLNMLFKNKFYVFYKYWIQSYKSCLGCQAGPQCCLVFEESFDVWICPVATWIGKNFIIDAHTYLSYAMLWIWIRIGFVFYGFLYLYPYSKPYLHWKIFIKRESKDHKLIKELDQQRKVVFSKVVTFLVQCFGLRDWSLAYER